MPRLFISIDMPNEITEVINKIQIDLKSKQLFDLNFVKPEKLHLTMKFLGQIKESLIDKIKDDLRLIKFNQFNAELGNLSTFTSANFIKIIWIDVISHEIKELQKKIEKSLSWLNNNKNDFVSHVTIARVKSNKNSNELKKTIAAIKIPNLKFPINSFILKKSEFSEEGTVYSDIEKFHCLN